MNITSFFRRNYFLPAYVALMGIWLGSFTYALNAQEQTQEQQAPLQNTTQDKNNVSASNFMALSRLYLPSLPTPSITNNQQQSMAQKVSTIEKRELMQIMYEIFAKTDTRQPSKALTFQNENLFTDLGMFCGSTDHPEHSVFNHMFEGKINTHCGRVMLQDMLYTPAQGADEVKSRQDAIKYLLAHPKEMAEFDTLLKQIAQHEETLISFFRKMDKYAERYLNTPYFKSEKWNKDIWLELIKWCGPLSLILSWTGWPIFVSICMTPAGIGTIVGLFKCLKAKIDFENQYSKLSNNETIWNSHALAETSEKILSMAKTLALILIGIIIFVIVFSVIMTALFLPFFLPFTQKIITSQKDLFFITNLFHKQLSSVSSFFSLCKQAKTMLESSDFYTTLANTTITKTLSDLQTNPKTNRLLNMLQSKTFSSSPQFFSWTGNILEANLLMNKEKNNFIDSFKAIGHMDALLAVAKLIKESEAREKNKYCFVDFVDEGKPTIDLEQCWMPLLDPQVAVANDFYMGGDKYPQCLVASGPNKAGKTTNMKSILLACLLGSRIGIAPCKQAQMAYIPHIATYAQPKDETGFASLFQAQVQRVSDLFARVDMLNSNEYFLIFGDEIMSGTNPAEAGATAYAIIKKFVYSYKNGLMLFSTHFTETADVEQETNGLCKNIKVSAQRNPENNPAQPYVYDHKISDGVSSQKIAIDLIESEKVISQDIVDAARRKMLEMETLS